jgi:septum formation protein
MSPPRLPLCVLRCPPKGAAVAMGRPGGAGASMHEFIYLASQSPRRRELLDQLGVRYELLLPDADEDAESIEQVVRGESPTAYVQRVTRLKAQAALARMKRRRLPAAPLLCSDTTVALGRVIYGKPADAKDAARMLGELSGRTHRVLTAVAVHSGRRLEEKLSVSGVEFAELAPKSIANYVATGEPVGKAGAYAVQGRAAEFIARISGSYSGIMGLPLFETAQLLKSARVKF